MSLSVVIMTMVMINSNIMILVMIVTERITITKIMGLILDILNVSMGSSASSCTVI